jgi:hypothetical protein
MIRIHRFSASIRTRSLDFKLFDLHTMKFEQPEAEEVISPEISGGLCASDLVVGLQ